MTRRGLTEFTYTRFLTPYLADYSGISLFLDSDILCRADVTELLAHTIAYPDIPVFVVHHALAFERPSVMLFNNSLCRILTPDYVNDARNNLFNLSWARTVGELPRHWNHLVGYDPPNPSAKLVHFTKGIPIWAETRDCEYSAEWNSTAKRMFSSVSFQELMGRSVHV
jgi:lipopolysaccharide biosynthesis glycosyltransferase